MSCLVIVAGQIIYRRCCALALVAYNNIMRKTFFLFLLLLGIAVPEAWAQGGEQRMMEDPPPFQPPKEVKRSFIRQALNKLTLGISTGYGHTFYRQELDGYSVVKRGDTHLLIPRSSINVGAVNTVYTNWITNPQERPEIIRPDEIMVSGDTASLGLNGYGQSLPLNLSLHINLMERVKVGGGVSAELYSIRPLHFSPYGDVLGSYDPEVNSALLLRYYGSFGVRAGRWYFWDFTPDIQLGKKKFLGNFNQDLYSNNVYYNFGLLIERHYSEYFRLTLRPSAEWASYDMRLSSAEQTVGTQAPAVYLQAGISMNYPRLPRCPINQCHIQMDHVHFGKEYRGQPIHRWQNPKYGQNHPELMRHKKRRSSDTENRLQYKKKKRNRFLFF